MIIANNFSDAVLIRWPTVGLYFRHQMNQRR